jgi:hypothetical protein
MSAALLSSAAQSGPVRGLSLDMSRGVIVRGLSPDMPCEAKS